MNRRNYGCRITKDVVIKGNQVVIMENQLLRITVLADQGADIIELLYKPKDIDFMWRSPVDLHKKSEYISSTGDSFCNYLDHNSGGWQEILPNGGSECYYKGACLGMHGEISNIPWSYNVIKDDEDEICVEFCVQTLRSPFRLIRRMTLKSMDSNIYLDETLSNLAYEEMELMWGHHPTVGSPFLDESCTIEVNAKTAFTGENMDFETQRLLPGQTFTWPLGKGMNGQTIDLSTVPSKDNKTADMIYFKDFPKEANYKVCNHNLNLSFGVSWDGERFPYCWLWQVCGGSNGYPWYGRTYNMAIEPWTSYPGLGLTKAIENGTSLKMKERESISTSLVVSIKEELN